MGYIAALYLLKKDHGLSHKREVLLAFASYSLLVGIGIIGHYSVNPFVIKLQVFRHPGLVMMLAILMILFSWKKFILPKLGYTGVSEMASRSPPPFRFPTPSGRVFSTLLIFYLVILGVVVYQVIHQPEGFRIVAGAGLAGLAFNNDEFGDKYFEACGRSLGRDFKCAKGAPDIVIKEAMEKEIRDRLSRRLPFFINFT